MGHPFAVDNYLHNLCINDCQIWHLDLCFIWVQCPVSEPPRPQQLSQSRQLCYWSWSAASASAKPACPTSWTVNVILITLSPLELKVCTTNKNNQLICHISRIFYHHSNTWRKSQCGWCSLFAGHPCHRFVLNSANRFILQDAYKHYSLQQEALLPPVKWIRDAF